MPKSYPKLTKRRLCASVIALASAGSVHADITKEIEDVLNFYHYGSNGAVKADLNYRWENVSEEGGKKFNGQYPETANANTARLRLGYLTPFLHDFQAYGEYEGNYALQEDYNNTLSHGRGSFSKIVDPDRSELNQFWLTYKGIADTLVKVGRQRIKLDDDRFIGNVGWRQMEQTYDSALVTHKSSVLLGLTVTAGFLDHVQKSDGTTDSVNAPILNINYPVGDWGHFITYGYWLNYKDNALSSKSSQSYGVRFDGKSPLFWDSVNFLYTTEWSNQSNYADNPNQYQVDRFNFMGGATAFNLTLQGAVEQLNGASIWSNSQYAFQTPLGSSHAFQGWADLFLTTPGSGVRDVFATAKYKVFNDSLIMTVMYHDFFDDTGKTQYGREWDFSVMKKFGKHYALLAKYVQFNTTDSHYTDTQKICLLANVSF